MPYYNEMIEEKYPELMNYFKSGIYDSSKNLGHCLLFWGPDIQSQCELALEIARLYNCNQDGNKDCQCLNCRWIREQTHPAVKVFTRLDFKEGNEFSSDDESKSSGKKNITVEQAKSIVNELAVSSDYHRVYILCDRDEKGNLLPLNKINFPEKTSNALLKTFEEPPANTLFIILTKDKTDVISTIVSRAQSFFIPANVEQNLDFDIVENVISNYWTIEKNDILDFENNLLDLISKYDSKTIFTQMQNYIFCLAKSNFKNKKFYLKLMNDLTYVEDAQRQISLSPAMNISTVVENLCFKIIL